MCAGRWSVRWPIRAMGPHPCLTACSAQEERVLVVNEAFGTIECWAEGSLTMAENAAHKLGLGRPLWLPESVCT